MQQIVFHPIEKDLLYNKISESIYAYIKKNGLKSGDRLPSEREMAQMFHTGRNAVREAIRVLEDRDILEVKPGRGTYIKEPTNPSGTLQLNLKDCKAEDLLELKTIIERGVVQKGIERGTPKQKADLVQAAEQMQRLADNGVYSDIADHVFHRKYLQLCGNSLVEELIMYIRENNFVRMWDERKIRNEGWLVTVPMHCELAAAIQQGDLARAIRALDEIEDLSYKVAGLGKPDLE